MKMDPTKERCVTQKRIYFCDGHLINYAISVDKLSVFQSWPFKKIYKTECKSFPTSWDFKVEFLEVREDATASLSVTFKRSDFINIHMEAKILVHICDPYTSLIFPKIVFQRVNMLPGDVFQDIVEISSFPEKRQAVTEGLAVHISIMIASCHVDKSYFSSLRFLDELEFEEI